MKEISYIVDWHYAHYIWLHIINDFNHLLDISKMYITGMFPEIKCRYFNLRFDRCFHVCNWWEIAVSSYILPALCLQSQHRCNTNTTWFKILKIKYPCWHKSTYSTRRTDYKLCKCQLPQCHHHQRHIFPLLDTGAGYRTRSEEEPRIYILNSSSIR